MTFDIRKVIDSTGLHSILTVLYFYLLSVVLENVEML